VTPWLAAILGIVIPLALMVIVATRLELAFGAPRENYRRSVPLLFAGLISALPVIAQVTKGPRTPWPYLLWFGAWCVAVLLALAGVRAWLRHRFPVEWPGMQSGAIEAWPDKARGIVALVALGLAVLFVFALGLSLGGRAPS
jgi:hypothetical protein